MAPPNTITLTNQDNQGQVTLHPGDALVVRLSSAQGTGAQWNLVAPPSSPLVFAHYETTSLTGPKDHPGPPFPVGGAQVEEFRFTAPIDREARSAAVVDREARSAAVVDREARSAAVVDREARSAAVVDQAFWLRLLLLRPFQPDLQGATLWQVHIRLTPAP
jgi:predicted secreted protein